MESVFFPKFRHEYAVIDSTQNAARSLAVAEGIAAAGHVFLAAEQTAGRGRLGRQWHTPPGANLCQTMIGGPVANANLWQLPFLVGVALQDALAQIAPNLDAKLRFPNDVYIRGKKVAGILIETASGPGIAMDQALPLIGVGVNVLGGIDAFPPDVAVRATTLEAETGTRFAVHTISDQFCAALTQRWHDWQNDGGWLRTLAAWQHGRDTDSRRGFEIDGEIVSCRVLSVDADGTALLELPDGNRRTIPVAGIVLA